MKINKRQLRRIIREVAGIVRQSDGSWALPEKVAHIVPPGGFSPHSNAYIFPRPWPPGAPRGVVPFGDTPEEHREVIQKILIAKVTHVIDNENMIDDPAWAPGTKHDIKDWHKKVDDWLEGGS